MDTSLLLAQTGPEWVKEFSLSEEGSTFWMPPQAGSTAAGADSAFAFIMGVSAFFFALICVLMVYYVIRYRRPYEGAPAESTVSHNATLEIVWTVIPLILVMVMFWGGFKTFMANQIAPGNTTTIQVKGAKWHWTFTYPNGHVDTELHLEQDRPFQFIIESADVTHSFYIPAFRLKKDAVPGRYNKAWVTPLIPGEYRLFCAEYCGTQHSDMVARVVVHQPGRWQVWLDSASDDSDMPPAERGKKIWSGIGGCVACHSIDGTRGNGPTWKNIWGQTENVLVKGEPQTVTVDEDYVRESILNPNAKLVAGFAPIMNTYKGQLSDSQIAALIEFIKTLSDDYVPPVAPAGQADDTASSQPTEPNTPAALDGEPNSAPGISTDESGE